MSNYLGQIFLIFLLTNQTYQRCAQGCLTCNDKDECLQCDVRSSYKLENSDCVAVSANNCTKRLNNGNCYECAQGYYLNNSNNTCTIVPSNKAIQNCFIYSSTMNCTQCSAGYYISSTCILVDAANTIANCTYYDSKTSCRECATGFLLSYDQKSCTIPPSIANCQSYNQGTCNACQNNYFLNQDVYMKNLMQFTSSTQRNDVSRYFIDSTEGRLFHQYTPFCEEVVVLNCLEIETAQKCKTCNIGYFLDAEKICIENPKEGVANCDKYITETTCEACQQNFYLQNQGICAPIDPIQNCLKYDTTSSTSQCLECASGRYSNSTSCESRVDSVNIANCSVYNRTADQCLTCKNNYFLSKSQILCLANISNCITNTDFNDIPSCEKCASTFYLNNNTSCQKGNISNCGTYLSDANNCLKCQNKYYLNGGQCTAHATLSKCETYSPTQQDICHFCQNNYYNYWVQSKCKDYPKIANCLEYEPNPPISCKVCDLGYFLQNSGCQLITVQNCATYDGSNCLSCDEGYALYQSNSNTVCRPSPTFISTNCLQTSVQKTAGVVYDTEFTTEVTIPNVKCEKCQSYYYPQNLNSHYICVKDSELDLFNIQLDNITSNCAKINDNGDCIQCNANYFYNSIDKVCVQTCPQQAYQLVGFTQTSAEYEFTNVRICVDLTDGEEILGIDVSNTTTTTNTNTIVNLNIILKCKDTHISIYNIKNEKYSNINFEEKDQRLLIKDEKAIMDVFPAVSECLIIDGNNPLINNCEYYYKQRISSTDYGRCLKCNHGYASTITNDPRSSSLFTLQNCQMNSECRNTKLGGLDVQWAQLFSCHECNNNNRIPFLAIMMESSSRAFPSRFNKYNMQTVNHSDRNNYDLNLRNIQCIQESAANLGYDTSTSSSNNSQYYQALPINCGLGVINLSMTNGRSTNNRSTISSGSSSSSNLAHFCAACKPGYKPTNMNDIYNHIKVLCTQINNCSGKDWFNSCSKCTTGHVFQFASGIVDYSACVNYTENTNCLAATSNGLCGVCKKGFQLRVKDFICEAMTPANCSGANFFNLKQTYARNQLVHALYWNTQGFGCDKCNNGYYSTLITGSYTNTYLCLYSNYIQTNTNSFDQQNSLYVKYCENYATLNNVEVCVKCITNKVLSPNKQTCYDGPANCEISNGNSECQLCLEGYYLVSGFCGKPNIPFCKTPNRTNSTNSTVSAQCEICQANYYLTQLYKCEKGNVPNCELYDNFNIDKCSKCVDGYARFQGKSRDICQQLDNSLLCKNADIRSNAQYGGEIQCTECKQPYQLITDVSVDITQRTICHSFLQIANCLTYDKQQTLQASTLECTACNELFYLSNPFICTKRTYLSNECTTYELDENNCKICRNTSYRDTNGQCIIRPSGVANCLTYSDKTTCSECNINYYLSGNNCIQVDPQTLIVGCELYENATNCKTCQSSYVLNGTICTQAVAQSCLTYASKDACATCESGFGLQTNASGITDCVFSSTQNCIQQGTAFDAHCEICQQNYFPNGSGVCTLASPLISNCEVYSNNDVCTRCTTGYALKKAKDGCVLINSVTSKSDANCGDYLEDESCSICRAGYVFQDGVCVACQQSGCLYCDFEESQCLMCQSGYWMDSNLNCVFIVDPNTITAAVGLVNVVIGIFGLLALF